MFIGTIGFFFALLFLFIRFLPMISIFEMRTILPKADTDDQDAPIYGVLAEFDTPDDLVKAVRRARSAGYRKMDAYTPFPIEHLAEELGFHRTYLPLIVLIGGLLGCAAGFGLQYWISVIDYPVNVGGRPLNSWPAFIPVTFETPF